MRTIRPFQTLCRATFIAMLFIFQPLFSAQTEKQLSPIHKQKYEWLIKTLQGKVARRDQLRKKVRLLQTKKAKIKDYKRRLHALSLLLQKNRLYLHGDQNERYKKLLELCNALRQEKKLRDSTYWYIRTSTLRWLFALGAVAGVIGLIVYLSTLEKSESESEDEPEDTQDNLQGLRDKNRLLRDKNSLLRDNQILVEENKDLYGYIQDLQGEAIEVRQKVLNLQTLCLDLGIRVEGPLEAYEEE